MGSTNTDMAMDTPWLPHWLRLVWAAALLVVLLLHVWHAWSMSDQPRWWHLGHTLMAAGMGLMYLLPRMAHETLYRFGVPVFALLTVATVTLAAVLYLRERVLNPLWLVSAVDMLVMTYMLQAAWRPAVVGYVLAAYLCGQAVAWCLGLWRRVPALESGTPTPGGSPGPGGGAWPAGAGSALAVATAAPPAEQAGHSAGLRAPGAWDVRVSLAVMALSMAYMVAIM